MEFKLPFNDANVVASCKDPLSSNWIILVVRNWQNHTPFIVWHYSPISEECYWGKYFSNYSEAVLTFTQKMVEWYREGGIIGDYWIKVNDA